MILRKEYRDDLCEWIEATPDEVFVKKEDILADEAVMDRLWTVYQKDIEEYECAAWWAYQDSLKEVLGIDYDASGQ